VGFADSHLVAGDHRLERAGRQCFEHWSDKPLVGHRDQPAGDPDLVQLGQQLAGARLPRDGATNSGDDAVQQPFNDFSRR
jgi:hypothetical protein